MKKLNDDQILQEISEIHKSWKIENNFLCRTVVFQNFISAFSFMTKVAFHAEILNHHPDWSNVYNKVSFKLSTHEIDGISIKDFELAKKIDDELINHT